MTPSEKRDDSERRFWSHMKAAAEAIGRKNRDAIVLEMNVLVGMLDLELKRNPRHERLAKGMVRSLGEAKRELEKRSRK